MGHENGGAFNSEQREFLREAKANIDRVAMPEDQPPYGAKCQKCDNNPCVCDLVVEVVGERILPGPLGVKAAKAERTEPDGMCAAAIAIDKQEWPCTVDAKVWAEEWRKRLVNNPSMAADEGAMLGWFANAIMAGFDTANARNAKAQSLADDATKFPNLDDYTTVRRDRDETRKELEEFKRKYHLAANAEERAAALLRAEKERNLLDRKQILFLNAVQTWLLGMVSQGMITPCRAAEIQLQAACVPPSVLGAVSVPLPTTPILGGPPFPPEKKPYDDPKMNGLAWQACDFCKYYIETNSWPAWTVANGPKAGA